MLEQLVRAYCLRRGNCAVFVVEQFRHPSAGTFPSIKRRKRVQKDVDVCSVFEDEFRWFVFIHQAGI